MLTLAHLTDVHLAPVAKPSLTSMNAKQLLGMLNWYRKRRWHHLREVLDIITSDLAAIRPDHIAVTGDLINIGFPEEQVAALEWLKSLGGPDLVTAIPGNHDVYGPKMNDPGIERWRPYMRGNGAGRTDGFPFVKTLGKIALVGASSAVPTPMFLATGRLGEAQRIALAETLAALRTSGYVRVLLIHHPPLPGQANRLRWLEDAADLTALLAREGAELVLHGHNHRPMYAETPGPAGPIPVVGAPSASATLGHHEPPAGYSLFRFTLEDGRCHIHLTRRAYGPGQTVSVVEQRQLTA